ncbi:MAG: NAD(P)H-quinone oxidoreductase [Alphaproteobacteria bacterium]|nr:NAD(P)H-quinone oxidoreductase [Alphaproteobacteria bacterium]
MAIPRTMNCVEIETPGGPEVLKPASRPVPQPGAGEVLVQVAAAGVNRPDVLQRRGMYAPPPGASDLPGLEIAGTVAAAGSGVSRWKQGDQVCALVAGGGYAAFCVAPEAQCMAVPKGLDVVGAACLPETVMTVWTNVFERGRLGHGESFLVHGGASGIGTTAIQMAKAWGCQVFATAGGADKVRACRDLGADLAIDYKTEDFAAKVKEATGKHGVDVILDMVGGDYFARNLDCMAVEGRLVYIAYLRGGKVELNIDTLMRKRLTVSGSTLRPRSVAEKGAIARAVEAEMWPHVAAGRIKPLIHARFPLAEAAKAHALMEANTHIGKIVLTL